MARITAIVVVFALVACAFAAEKKEGDLQTASSFYGGYGLGYPYGGYGYGGYGLYGGYGGGYGGYGGYYGYPGYGFGYGFYG